MEGSPTDSTGIGSPLPAAAVSSEAAATVAAALAPQPPRVALHLEYDHRVNFAMQQNDVPVVKLLRVENLTDCELSGVSIAIAIGGGLSQPWRRTIDSIAPRATFNIDAVDLRLDPAALARQTEREATTLRAQAAAAAASGAVAGNAAAAEATAPPSSAAGTGEQVIGEAALPIEVLAFNEWAGVGSLPEMLAAFVTPNHPSVESVLADARPHLERLAGSPSFSGYQSRSIERVRRCIEAIYLALIDRDLAYVNPPASFEKQGQKVRFAEQIFANRLGTCLDLALLLASCVEQAGLHPLVVLTEGHAFLGIWLNEDSFPEPAVDDLARLRKRVQLGELLVIEATALTTRPVLSFDEAVTLAQRHLLERDDFHVAIDIRCARKLSIRPLPIRVGSSVIEILSPAPLAPGASAPTPSQPQASALLPTSGQPKEEEEETPHARLERWKRKLLDLSSRNRLINFRESNKSIPLLCPDLSAIEDALAGGKSFALLHRPKLMERSNPRSLDAAEQRIGDDPLTKYLLEELSAGRAHSSLTENELTRRLVEIYRAARLSLEESGANTLYLAVGFLVWYETTARDAPPRRAPILLIPIDMNRRSVREGFSISHADEDPRINVTLLEKLKVEFGIDTAGLEEAVEDDAGLNIAEILQRWRRAIRDIDRWEVVDEAHLGLFSFQKFLMWLDLQERSKALMRSAVVKHLVERPPESFSKDATFPQAATLDEERRPQSTFCPLDADSSQLTAVFAADDGRSFVLEGPPGTGKSQTITNLIAQCLASGKRVLFVAEKMAALNVVKSRLQRVGLGPFCLELHSNKASKREVLDQLQESLDITREAAPAEWERQSQELAATRGELNRFVSELHQPRDIGRSVYEITSRLIGRRETPRVFFDPRWVRQLDQAAMAVLDERVEQFATAAATVGDVAVHPLRGIERTLWQTSLPDQVTQAADGLAKAATALEQGVDAVLREAGVVPAPFPPREGLGEGAAPGQLRSPHSGAAAATSPAMSVDARPSPSPSLGGRGIKASLSRNGLEWLRELVALLLESPRPTDMLLTDPAWADLRHALVESIARGKQRDAWRTSLLHRWRESLMQQDLDQLLLRVRKGITGFALTAWYTRWRVRSSLAPHAQGALPDNEQIAADLELAIKLRSEQRALTDGNAIAAQAFGSQWRGGEADWAQLELLIAWVDRFRALMVHAGLRDFDSASIKTRCIALAIGERDACAATAPVGRAMQTMAAGWVQFEDCRGRMVALLDVNEAAAWGQPPERDYLLRVRESVQVWTRHLLKLQDWCYYRRARQAAMEAGLSPLVEASESSAVAPQRLAEVFVRSVDQQWLSSVMDETEQLRDFNSREHERKIARFARQDREQFPLVARQLRSRFAAQVPRVQGEASDASEVGILQRQLKLQRRHMPVRKLIQKLPNLLPRLKPCLLMSPLSVAQYLDASFPPVDVVVFDEASQIPVWDAVGVIARGTQVVGVGDSKQLPPTNFFMKVDDGEEVIDEDDFEELESILDECVAAGLPSLRLLWHYRSRHESLITFSNYHYYDNRLQTFPSPIDKSPRLGVSLRFMEGGVYDRGGDRVNRAEAQAIVDEIVSRLTNSGTAATSPPTGGSEGKEKAAPAPRPSIGVVTFSIPQQALIEDMLDAKRREKPEIEPYFTDAVPEPVFVKNLENVQGDERDIILFSICYGPDKDGKVAMGFGPLNRDGGERRLNVAITRAREQVIVFSSLRADQIDLSRTQAVAVKHLRAFLDYAARGPQSIAEAVTLADRRRLELSFEDDVRDALMTRGFAVDMHVGCSGFRIDLAVKDPKVEGQYLLGVLCDGPFYSSAHTARDRDRLRQSVLENLGWRLHRVWSIDWWADPTKEVERIVAAVAGAGGSAKPQALAGGEGQGAATVEDVAVEDVAGDGVDAGKMEPVEVMEEEDDEPGEADVAGPSQYQRAKLNRQYGEAEQFYRAGVRRQVRDVLLRVVRREAPILWDVAARRVTACWGFRSVTDRADNHLKEMLKLASAAERPVLVDGCLWRSDQAAADYRGYRLPREDDDDPRTPDEIPPIELANAAEEVLRQQIGLPREDLVREVGRLFGASRLSKASQAAIERGLGLLEQRGGCIEREGLMTLPR